MRPRPESSAAAQAVLGLVAEVPSGSATTYGDLAAIAADLAGVRVTARQVGQIMAGSQGSVPWWRVVAHDGRPPAHLRDEAIANLRRDGCPLRGARVDLRLARWTP